MGIKISNLPAIVSPALSDFFPVVQSGDTYKETCTQLISLIGSSFTGYLQSPLGVKDPNGNITVQWDYVASSVNYIKLQNSATGNPPQISAQGTDANIPMNITSKGTSPVRLVGGNTTSGFQVFNGTSAQHSTLFSFANTAASRTITVPDQAGTIYLSNKANGTEAANAVTANGTTGVITTSSLTTASGASYVITWTNTFIAADSTIIISLMGGTNTKDTLQIKATAGVGTSTLTITNNNVAALDGTVLIGYIVIP